MEKASEIIVALRVPARKLLPLCPFYAVIGFIQFDEVGQRDWLRI
jgi:hypothetical protein